MVSLAITALLCALLALYYVYRRYSRVSLSHVRGPKPQSFLLGSLRQLFHEQVGEYEFKWQAQYGGAVRFKGALGEDMLLLSDPKALQYIYHTSGYAFQKQFGRRELSRMGSGHGVLWADGDVHKRQRRVMQAGFGMPEAKAFLPLFSGCARKITTQWTDCIISDSQGAQVFNVSEWFSRATLDAIGEAAFDYDFGSMENSDNELKNAYNHLLVSLFSAPTDRELFFRNTVHCLPEKLVTFAFDHAPSAKLEYVRHSANVADGVARALVQEKQEAALLGKGKRDIMSILVQSNAGEGKRGQLDDYEMISQMRVVMLAGHETTANTLSWALHELSQNLTLQSRLRAEIWNGEQALQAKGLSWSAKEFESMPFLTAFVKEVFRFYPVAYHNFREPVQDQVVPLSTPIIGTNGEVLQEIVVPKGTKVVLSIAGYNRVKSVWGEDAHTFNPDRWLHSSDEKRGASVGVYANLLTFSGGVRSCLGWRFAVIELQAFLVELVSNFVFEATPESQRIRREGYLVMTPTVEGEIEKGQQLPLRVSIASRD